MNFCNCTLIGTKACFTCPNNVNGQRPIPKKQRVIEKYDGDGKLVERIVEDIE